MDGQRNWGHIALRDGMELAIAKARQHGISAVTVRNCDFAGRFAPFCERAAEAGMASMIFGNDNGSLQSVLPPGAVEPRLSTNPIGMGVPRANAPHLVLDFATSTVASGRLHEEKERGNAPQQDWVGAGGALKTFGGFKGFGLALMVEALGGALSGSDTVSAKDSEQGQGALLIAIDIAQLRDIDEYTAQVEEFTAWVKGAEREPGAGPLRVPGENAPGSEALDTDTAITLNPNTCQQLDRIAGELGLPAPARQ